MTVDIAIIEHAAEVAVQRALTRIVQPIIRHGTCVEPSIASPGIHEILVDGDSESIACHDVTGGINMGAGARVTILFAPPHQALIIGMVDPMGPVRQFTTEADVSYTTSTVTDFVLTSVPMIGGHVYGVHLHSVARTSSVVVAASWQIELRVDGTVTDRLWHFNHGVTGTTQWMVDGWVYHTPDESGDFDLDVFADEIVDGMNLEFLASPTAVRSFTVFDFGINAVIPP